LKIWGIFPILGEEKAIVLKDFIANLEQQASITKLFELARVEQIVEST